MEVKRRLRFLFSSSSKRSSSRFFLSFSVATVGVWATRLRCPSEAAYPQRQPVAPPLPCRCATVHWLLVSHGLMRSTMVVEVFPSADAGPRFAAVGVGFQIDLLIFDRAPQPLDEDVVHEAAASVHRDRDPRCLQLAGNAALVNCAPWSVLSRQCVPHCADIRGLPYRRRASSSASTQNALSIVFDSRQASTARLAQSMIAPDKESRSPSECR